MHAAYLRRYGPAQVLQYGERPAPQAADRQVLIRVHAAGVNPIDWRIRNGSLRLFVPGRLPRVLGYDVSGVIAELGHGVEHVQRGDEVYCMLDVSRGGAYAEYAVAAAKAVAPKPAGLTHVQAAVIPLAACTALQALRDLGGITAGSRVLINGASGGVGTFAVQLAKAFGAEVAGVCSSRNLDLVRQLGADHLIDYDRRDFTREAACYDIVLDAVAKSSFASCRRILAPQGSYIRTVPTLSQMLLQGLTRLLGGRRCQTVWVWPNSDDLRLINRLVASDQLRPVVARVFALRDADQAHRLSEAGHVSGKLALAVPDP